MLGITGLFGLSVRGAESLCGHEGLVAVDFAKLDDDVVEILQSSAAVRNAPDYDEEDVGLTEFDPFSEE